MTPPFVTHAKVTEATGQKRASRKRNAKSSGSSPRKEWDVTFGDHPLDAAERIGPAEGSSGEEEPPARSRSRGKTSGSSNRKRPAPAGRQEAMETLNGPVPGPKELCIAAGKLRAKEAPVVSPPPLVSPLECCVEWERRQVGKRGI